MKKNHCLCLPLRAAAIAVFMLNATMQAMAATYYVKITGNDASAGTSWATAKQTIQAAVNLAVNGDTVLVSNGTYSSGTTVTPGFITSNRVVITNNILVKSVNGPDTTTIQGTENGIASPLSTRCVYMTAGTLVGFRLTQGRAPLISTNDAPENIWGGGAYAPGGTIEDCIINNNDAFQGGGVYDATLRRCNIFGNDANTGGGAKDSTLYNCILTNNSAFGGGGADNSLLYDCVVSGNSGYIGGGLSGGVANRCKISGNAAGEGGGALSTTLNNCLVVSNAATSVGGVFGGILRNSTVAHNTAESFGGVFLITAYNSIIYSNTSISNAVHNHAESEMYSSCTTPSPTNGANNITNNPLFRAAGDYRLMTNSPCVNSGSNAYILGYSTIDIDGNPRIEGGTVDRGAYEICRIHYVAPGGASIAPYTRWSDAATNIQVAVDVAIAGDTIIVSNGVYDSGTRVTPSFNTSNRLVVTKNVQVISANGPAVTTIKGLNVGNSLNSARCLYMSSGSLSGFTLTGGYAQGLPPTFQQNRDGGGAYMDGGSLSNCWIVGNTATSGFGGGVRGGTLYDCQVLNNVASSGGGGAYQSTLFDCILSGNSSLSDGGGAYEATLTRCQVTGNTASNLAGGVFFGSMGNCLINENVASGAAGGAYVVSMSNCTVIGNSASNVGGVAYCTVQNSIVYNNTDLTGNPNLLGGTNVYSCIWPNPGGAGNITNNPRFASAGSTLLASNSPCINAGSNLYAAGTLDLGSRTRILQGIVDMGAYEYDFYPVHYVAPGGASVSPFATWADAATNIQDAIDVAKPGELVLVSNGVYNSGTRLTPGFASSNRIVLNKDVTVRSVNGPSVTIIQGEDNGNNYGSVRCAYLTAGVLSGFTLTDGATPSVSPQDFIWEENGGGAFLAGGVLERCIITGNFARGDGGGVHGGTLYACIISDNLTPRLSGAASSSILNNCAIFNNISAGAIYCTLNNCSVANNNALVLGDPVGTIYGTARNSIVYNNNNGVNYQFTTFYNSCTTPMPTGSQNITNNPLFVNYVAGNLRLMSNSPCINKGTNVYVVADIDADGNSRIVNGIVDMGAYEFFIYSPSGYWAWAAAITNGMTNLNDNATGDGYPNLLKYVTGSSATNADNLADLLIMPVTGGADVVFNRNTNAVDTTIYVEVITNLFAPSWKPVATNRLGSWGGAPLVSEQGAGSVKSVSVDNPNDTNLLYRLRVTRP